MFFFVLFCCFCRIWLTKCPQTENKKEQKRSCRRENRKMSFVFFVVGPPPLKRASGITTIYTCSLSCDFTTETHLIYIVCSVCSLVEHVMSSRDTCVRARCFPNKLNLTFLTWSAGKTNTQLLRQCWFTGLCCRRVFNVLLCRAWYFTPVSYRP